MTSPTTPNAAQRIYLLARPFTQFVANWLRPVFDLALRLYVAEVFIRSGLLKLANWPGTLQLFDYVYQVPVLPPHLAAVMGAFGELFFPLLLVLGVAGRFGAAGLFVVNLTAAISFPDISDLGLRDHILWATILAMLVFHGPGKLSLDYWLPRRWGMASKPA